MTNLNIVCDCDSVLLDFSKSFARWHNRIYTDYKLKENPDDYQFSIDTTILYPRIYEFYDTDLFGELAYMTPDIPNKFNKLSKHNTISIISAVPPKYTLKRANNLSQLCNVSDLILNENKIPMILGMRPDICIEDSPNNVRRLTEAGIKTFYPTIPNYSKLIVKNEFAIPYDDWDQLLNLIYS